MTDTKKTPTPIEAEVKAEETEQTHATVTFKGMSFTFPTTRLDWSVDAIEAFEDGKSAAIVRELVEPRQWQAFKATRPSGRDLLAVSNLLAVELGFTNAGESAASSD